MRHLLAALLLSASIHALAQAPGDLDSTFSGDGMLFIDSLSSSTTQPLVLREQGENLLFCYGRRIMRLLPDGALDTTFGSGGIVSTSSQAIDAIAMQIDGRFLVVKHIGGLSGNIQVKRYLIDGGLDSTYAVNGTLNFSRPGAVSFDAELQSDEKLLVCGVYGAYPQDTGMVFRSNPNGELDTTFSSDGVVMVPGEAILSIVQRVDGSIVVTRESIDPYVHFTRLLYEDGTFQILPSHPWLTTWSAIGDSRPSHMVVNQQNMLCTRAIFFNSYPAGSGTDEWLYLSTCAPLETAKSYRLGMSYSPPGHPNLYYSTVADVAVDHGDGFLVTIASGGSWLAPWKIRRFNANGLVDSTFSNSGTLETEFSPGELCAPKAVISLSDGKFVVAGTAYIGGVNKVVICRYHNIPDPRAKLSTHVFLGGPYDPVIERMNDALRTNSLLPSTSPYQTLGYIAVGSSDYQTVHSGVLDFTGDSAIVDWVWVELLSAPDVDSVAAARAALVRRDGLVVGMDGRSPVDFNCGSGSYYVRIRHRNHLGVTASDPVALSATTTAVDFTSVLTNTFGTSAQDEVNGKRMLWPGDVTKDGMVKYVGAANDRDAILLSIGGVNTLATLTAYDRADVNMDGTIKYAGLNNDRDRVLLSIGGTSPTAVRMEQVP